MRRFLQLLALRVAGGGGGEGAGEIPREIKDYRREI